MSSEAIIRRYVPTDKPAILDICKDVYGGRDYIPRVIDEYTNNDTDVLVEAPSISAPVRALLCGAQDGSLYHIWGARTHPSERGKGIMRKLMQHVERNERHEGTERAKMDVTLVSTTIRENASMLRLFETSGFVEHENEMWLWPDSSISEEKDCTMTFVMNHYFERMNDTSRPPARLTACSCVDELRVAVRRARGTDDDRWIPASYEVIACDGRIMQDAIDNGDVFVSETLNAVVGVFGDQLGGIVLSVVCSASVLGDVLGAIHREIGIRTIKRMYVDTCGTNLSTAHFVHGAPRGWTSYIVLSKGC